MGALASQSFAGLHFTRFGYKEHGLNFLDASTLNSVEIKLQQLLHMTFATVKDASLASTEQQGMKKDTQFWAMIWF